MDSDAITSVTFDEDNKVRVLEKSKVESIEKVDQSSTTFTEKMDTFRETVDTLVEVLDTQGAQIEREKLKAIGHRGKVESEPDLRRRKERELKAQLAFKEIELGRLQTEFASLQKVDQEQRALIERLSNNDV